MKKQITSLIMLLLTSCNIGFAWDNLHFYRASFFFGEPRFERQALTTLNVRAGAGATDKGRDDCSQKTCLLDIFGPQVMFKLGENVPYKDLTTPEDVILQLLEIEPARNGFGLFSYGGRFKTAEVDLQLYQNLIKGFFLELYIPIRKLEISDIHCSDLSSDCPPCPNKNSPLWQSFLHQYNTILTKYSLCQAGVNHTGIGDTSVLAGWTVNYEQTEDLDFIDFTIEAGILFPTGRKANQDIIFDLPQGYNGHYGFPLNMSVAFGLYEWFTLGGHVMVLPFKNRTEELRMKTSTAQNGSVMLAKGCANVHHGTIWQAALYLKADHAIRNLSLLTGYSYSSERASTLDPINTALFDPSIVNSNDMLRGWNMHTIHLLAEFDFLKESGFWGPRFGIFGNIIVGGKRIFNTNMAGGTFGLDLVWSY
jgi:hypothetical protein